MAEAGRSFVSEASLVYRARSGTARARQRNPVSKKQKLTQLLLPFIHRMFLKDENESQAYWHMPLILAFKQRPGWSAW